MIVSKHKIQTKPNMMRIHPQHKKCIQNNNNGSQPYSRTLINKGSSVTKGNVLTSIEVQHALSFLGV